MLGNEEIYFVGMNDCGECLFRAGTDPRRLAAASSEMLPTKPIGIVTGISLTLMLAKDGEVSAVGKNHHGQLGRGHSNDNDPDNRVLRPVAGFGLERITLVAAGYSHCAAVTKGGKVLLWGWNAFGQCGTGTADGSVLAATRCDSGALADADVRVVFVACGLGHTVALTSDGGVIAFGHSRFGQLGTGNNEFRQPVPERLACAALVGVRIVGCAAGANFTHLVSDDGRIFAMGVNDNGQLGTGDTTAVNTPTEIDAAHFGGAPVAAVACGAFHTMAITRGEGKLYCWGEGADGATGLGHMDDATTPQPVVGALADVRVVRIAAGYIHSCALAEDGRVFAFGSCPGTFTRVRIPRTLIEGAAGEHALALAGTTVCAVSSGAHAYHVAFIEGPPPAEPDFEFGVPARTLLLLRRSAWLRRRLLLLCLLRTAQRGSAGGGEAAPPKRLRSSSGDPLVLQLISLPGDLWQGPLIFQFL